MSFSCYDLTTGNKASVLLSTADERILEGIITFVDLSQNYYILDISVVRIKWSLAFVTLKRYQIVAECASSNSGLWLLWNLNLL